MPNPGDTFEVQLNEAHLAWGVYRHTNTRDRIIGEAYIPIPAQYAREYQIYNANYGRTGLGYNEFNARSADRSFEGVLKASGNSSRGDIYAKNLHGSGDLRALGRWFNQVNMQPGDYVRVTWISSTEILLEKIE